LAGQGDFFSQASILDIPCGIKPGAAFGLMPGQLTGCQKRRFEPMKPSKMA
jgi:hypothetical protein